MAGKRGATDYITKDGIGAIEGQGDTPVSKATAAQLANRKIKQMRGPIRRNSPGPSQNQGFTPSFGGGAPSNSFPPTNGNPQMGNGSPNVSFGGFNGASQGGSSGGSGFSFGGGDSGGFNNPFASTNNNQAAPETNGASNAFNFNFGGSQPAAPAAAPFQFNGQPQAAQPASNFFNSTPQQQPSTMFGAAPSSFSPAPAAALTPSFGGFGVTAPVQTPASSGFSFGGQVPATTNASNGLGGFGGSTATTSSSTFSGFGATASPQPQQPSGFNLFGQSNAQTPATPAPAFAGFGQTPQTAAPAFGAPNGDSAMSISPDGSPLKQPAPTSTPSGWNRQPSNGVAASSDKISDGTESPDRPPHIEQEGETPVPNVFATIPRAPAPLFTPKAPDAQSSPSNQFGSIFNKKPDEPAKEQPSFFSPAKTAAIEKESEAAAEKPDLFASAPRLESAQSPSSVFGSPAPAEKAKPSSPFAFSSTPSQPSLFNQQTPSTAKQNSFQPSTSLFSPQKPAESPASAPTPSSNPFGSLNKQQAPASAMPKFAQPSAKPSTPTTPSGFEYEVLRDDNVPTPDAQLELSEEEVKYYYREYKLQRLNEAIREYVTSHTKDRINRPQLDFTIVFEQYNVLLNKIQNKLIEGRLTDLIAIHGHTDGRRKYDQETGRQPKDGSSKRSAPPQEAREEDKKAKTGAAPSLSAGQSDTSNKFIGMFNSAAQPAPKAPESSPVKGATPAFTGFGKSTASSTSSSKTSNLFAQAAASSPSAKGNMFGQAAASPAQPSNMFGQAAASSAQPSNMFGQAISKPAAGPAAPSFSMPKFTPVAGGNLMASFAGKAKAATEKARKDAKQRAKDEEWDSEDEEQTEAEWEAEYEEKQAAKASKLAATKAEGAKFVPTSSGDESEAPRNPFSSLKPPATSNSMFSSRSASPALSTAGASVFDMPRSVSPNLPVKSNIFGHLSDVEGGSHKDDADDEDSDIGDPEQTPRATNGTSPKRRGPFTEEEEEEEEGVKTPTPRSDGLFGRITRDNGDRTPLATTEANKPGLFNFAKTSSLPSDNTWTPKDPIKFSAPLSTSNGDQTTPKASLFSFKPITATKPAESAASPGVFSGLFSGTQGNASPFNPSTANPFGSLKGGTTSSLFPPSGSTSVFSTPGGNSRASSVALSEVSGAESTSGEQDDATPDPQVELDGLDKDKEGHDVLWEHKAKMTHLVKPDPEGDDGRTAPEWVVVGSGQAAILQNRETGVKSLLIRSAPLGKIVINAGLGAIVGPETAKKRVRFSQATPGGGLEMWLMGVADEEVARQFVEVAKAK